MHHHAWQIFVFLVETGLRQVGQAGLKSLTSGDLPALAFQSARITSMNYGTWSYSFVWKITPMFGIFQPFLFQWEKNL